MKVGINYACFGTWTVAVEQAGLQAVWQYQPETYDNSKPNELASSILTQNSTIPWVQPDVTANMHVGSPPCIGLSGANPQASLDHPANKNFLAFHKTVAKFEPDLYLVEICSPIMTRGKPLFDKAVRIVSSKYNIGHKIFEASDYGSPSKRKRMYALGIHKNSSISIGNSHPQFILDGLPLKKSIGSKAVIRGLEEYYNDMRPDNKQLVDRYRSDKKTLRAGAYSVIEKNPEARTLKPDEPSPTIVGAAVDTILHYHGKQKGTRLPRFLGIKEVQALMGFPLNWEFNPMGRSATARQTSQIIASGVEIHFTTYLLKHIRRELSF